MAIQILIDDSPEPGGRIGHWRRGHSPIATAWRGTIPGRGFTLIEMLVVISIVTLMIALLLPALGKSRESARRVLCGSQQRQLQVGVTAFSDDRAGKIPQSVLQWGGRYGPLIRQRDGYSSYSNLSDEISLEAMGKYVGFVSLTAPIVDRYTDIWWCPSSIGAHNLETANGLLTHHWSLFDYTVIVYSYFGRADVFPGFVTQPKQLVGKSLSSDQLMMNDVLYAGYGGGVAGRQWIFNHGMRGPAGFTSVPVDFLDGGNETYGDGHVRWKSGAEFDIPTLKSGAWVPGIGMMNGNAGPNYTYW